MGARPLIRQPHPAHRAAADSAAPWCSTLTSPAGDHVPGQWGHCAPLSLELAQQTFTNSTKTCADSRYKRIILLMCKL